MSHIPSRAADATASASLIAFFTQDHRACDADWAAVEAAAQAGDAASAWHQFDSALRRHLEMEETVLFPAFEAASGMTQGGPTFVMRAEHQQMRMVLDQMQGAATQQDWDELLDHGDTLLMLIQQHNAKEEAMLYPMAERFLGAQWPALRHKL